MQLFFYELHEGATDLMTDALLVSDRDHTPAEFERMVHSARAAVLDTYEEDTLVEDIGDEKLRASMSVGVEEEDTYLVEQSGDFRSIVAELERS
jgi:hypothetical protein